jgi:choline-phosphate cytidylyltransferase
VSFGPRPATKGRPQHHPPPAPDPPPAAGIFDLFHYGHARVLEQAKKAFPRVHLVVGVCSDELTHARKGATVMSHAERIECVRHCRWVDEIAPDAPWVIDDAFLARYDIDFVAHDDVPYPDPAGGTADVYAHLRAAGKFWPTQRTGGVSTTGLIARILDDRGLYEARNAARGDLGLGDGATAKAAGSGAAPG